MGRYKQLEGASGPVVEQAAQATTSPPAVRSQDRGEKGAADPSPTLLPFQVVREENPKGPPAVFVTWESQVQNPASGLFMVIPFKQYIGIEGCKGSPVTWGWPLVKMIEAAEALQADNERLQKKVETLQAANRMREEIAGEGK